MQMQNHSLIQKIDHLKQSIQAQPRQASLHKELGLIYAQMRDFRAAQSAFKRAVELAPHEPAILQQLGRVNLELNELNAASDCFTRLAVMLPNQDAPLLELARCTQRQGLFDQAILHYRHLLCIKPQHHIGLTELAVTYQNKGITAEAQLLLKQALTLSPNYAPALLALSGALFHANQFRESLDYLLQYAQQVPDDPALHNNFGLTYAALADSENAISHLRRAVAQNPQYTTAHSSLLFNLHYLPEIHPSEILAEARRFAALHTPASLPTAASYNHPRLRIAYISSDFRYHPVGLFVEPIIARHDATLFDIYIYSDVHAEDTRTQRIRSYVKHWIPTIHMSNEQVVQRIRQDEIDILIDLNGPSGRNRLPVLAKKPAPIQIEWMGHAGTTGLSTMDYMVTDDIAAPANKDLYLAEQALRLKHGVLCYRPELESWPSEMPVGDLPALRNGYITFASFNNLIKINDVTLKAWQAILEALPNARLFMKARQFGDAILVKQWQDRMQRLGLDVNRIELVPFEKGIEQHIRLHQQIDIHLDSYPYSGMTTTCEALWMGVPVIALAGECQASLICASLLDKINANDWIANTPDEYVAKALAMARDIPALAEIRKSLRQKVMDSAIYDAEGFTREFEQRLLEISTNSIANS